MGRLTMLMLTLLAPATALAHEGGPPHSHGPGPGGAAGPITPQSSGVGFSLIDDYWVVGLAILGLIVMVGIVKMASWVNKD